MINEEIISRRYVDAYLAYAGETIGFDRGLDELQRVKRIMRDNCDIKDFLESIEITDSEKYGIFSNRCQLRSSNCTGF